ncbi:MAG: 16S rRNA (guanine(966)-N(2))-methyltransferase RsmD [Pseudomonadales bacterium]
MSRGATDRTVRIIGGNWRSRKVSFAAHDDIRPTPARIRETLFNWLQYHIHGARCLELYAGSGILSIEALSRGAGHVTLVDSSRQVIDHAEHVLTGLCADEQKFECYRGTAQEWVQSCQQDPYDIVFLDPPFASDELSSIVELLEESTLLTDNALIYLESDSRVDQLQLPGHWTVHRQKRAGDVHYCLVIRDEDIEPR